MALTASKSPSRADGKPGFDDINSHRFKVPGNLQFFRKGERRPGRLFAVTQGRIKYSNRFHSRSLKVTDAKPSPMP